ncbi:MAG TPA: amino acid ABC transporter substrate-binding protein [Firmicutes bacterium]|nr:amino acid ABC transporter substrate-binding protein [Bacillota bacterium]
MRNRVTNRFTLLLVAFCLILLSVSAAAVSLAATDDSLEKVLKAGKLTIGIDDAYPPMEYRDEQNNLVGFDIDLAREIGKRLGVKVEWIPTEWSGVLLALNAHKFDIILSTLSVTEERAKQIDFGPPYLYESQVIVVCADNNTIKSKEDLVGKVVGTQLGSTSEEAAKTIKGIKELKKYNKFTEVFLDLGIGRIEAGVVDELVGRYYMKTRPDQFKVVASIVDEPVAIGYRKSDKKLQEAINKIVDEIKADGTMAKISKKWFGADITK